jgi:hypothetical protein
MKHISPGIPVPGSTSSIPNVRRIVASHRAGTVRPLVRMAAGDTLTGTVR